MASGGQPLDKHTQSQMSARFGHNFSNVRIHTDARAGDSAASLGANAYAHGSDIVFGEGRYTPGSRETERLLTHELTHIVQQAQNGPGDPARVSRKDDESEREAASLAADVTAGRSVEVQAAPGAAVARDEDEQRQRCVAGASNPFSPSQNGGAESSWKAWDDNPLWNFTTNDAVSGSVGMAQTHLSSLHEGALGQMNQAASETRLENFQSRRGWSPSEGTVEEMTAQKKLWQAGADLEEAEYATGGVSFARQAENTASRFSPALKTAGKVGRFLAPLGVYSDATSMVDDWKKGEHADAVADGLGLTSSLIGTADLAGAGLSMFGATAGAGGALTSFASAANPVGAVAGSAAGGYALGKYGLGKANTYAKNHDIFGKGDDGESRNSTEAAADAGEWVKEHTGGGLFGSILGGATAIGSSWGTAAYSGVHALGSGIANDAGWLWDHTFGDSGPSDEEMEANQKQADSVMTENMDAVMNAEMESDLAGPYTQVAHDDPPPPPR